MAKVHEIILQDRLPLVHPLSLPQQAIAICYPGFGRALCSPLRASTGTHTNSFPFRGNTPGVEISTIQSETWTSGKRSVDGCFSDDRCTKRRHGGSAFERSFCSTVVVGVSLAPHSSNCVVILSPQTHCRFANVENAPYAYNAGGVKKIQDRAEALTEPRDQRDRQETRRLRRPSAGEAKCGDGDSAKRRGVCGDPRL